MDGVSLLLLCVAGTLLLGALGEVVFQRTNIPDVVWLILAGILIGPVTGLVTRELLNQIAPYFAAITLVIVLFEGGSALKIGELSRVAPRSTLLAVLSFLFSAVLIAILSMLAQLIGLFPQEWSWLHGSMLGAILGGSSSIIIMPAMAQARVEPRVGNLVSLESALTDAFCVVGTSAIIDLLLRSEGAAAPLVVLARSFGIGLAVGLVAGLSWILFLRVLHSNEHAYPVTLAGLLILYVAVHRLGGSAAFAILTVAVLLGNAPELSIKLGFREPLELDTSVRGFHRQMTFIIKSFFFVFIGAMLGPPWSLILLGAVFGVGLFAARVPSVHAALVGSGMTSAEKSLIAVALPRGMAAGVLATLPASAGVPGTESLPVVVFACVFSTILIFAFGFPGARRRLATAGQPAPAAPVVPAVLAAVLEAPARASAEAGIEATPAGASSPVPNPNSR